MIHDPPLPPPFAERFAPLPEVKVSGPRSSFHNCFGCGPRHDIGLRVRTFAADGGVLAPIVVPRHFEGPPGAAHGGIVAAYLDEVLAGAAVNHTGRMYVTGELTVRYVKGTPIERPLLGRGRAVLDSGKYIDLEATIEDWETGEVVAKATARFLPIKDETVSQGAGQGAETGPAARRRPKVGARRTSCTLSAPTEGANEADGPVSTAC